MQLSLFALFLYLVMCASISFGCFRSSGTLELGQIFVYQVKLLCRRVYLTVRAKEVKLFGRAVLSFILWRHTISVIHVINFIICPFLEVSIRIVRDPIDDYFRN